MKYISCLAAIGLVQSKTALVIDDQKIIKTATQIQDAVIKEAQTPEFMDAAKALQDEIEKAAIKVDISLNKLVTPVLKKAADEVEIFSFGEECQVHKFYQCLVDEGTLDEGPVSASRSACADETNCHVEAYELDFDWEGYYND